MKKLAFISLIFTIVIASSLVLVNTNLTPVFAILLDLSNPTTPPALEVNAAEPAANTSHQSTESTFPTCLMRCPFKRTILSFGTRLMRTSAPAPR
jgi:hypothetical protein